MGEQTNYAQPYPAPQAQYMNNPQEAPPVTEPAKYIAPETVSRGGRAPAKGKLGFLEGFLTAMCCCCCVEECCCCDLSICF
uniref:Cysteine-rich transmembrane CYSTM domain-containing protein n=1 Tax=Kalanchoe fedtschenkoi TaxID=63787 RepID=A0A7N0R8U7_KALFE